MLHSLRYKYLCGQNIKKKSLGVAVRRLQDGSQRFQRLVFTLPCILSRPVYGLVCVISSTI